MLHAGDTALHARDTAQHAENTALHTGDTALHAEDTAQHAYDTVHATRITVILLLQREISKAKISEITKIQHVAVTIIVEMT